MKKKLISLYQGITGLVIVDGNLQAATYHIFTTESGGCVGIGISYWSWFCKKNIWLDNDSHQYIIDVVAAFRIFEKILDIKTKCSNTTVEQCYQAAEYMQLGLGSTDQVTEWIKTDAELLKLIDRRTNQALADQIVQQRLSYKRDTAAPG